MTFVLCTANCVCENCVKTEQKNAKQNNRTWLEGLLTVREYYALSMQVFIKVPCNIVLNLFCEIVLQELSKL